MRNLIKTKLRLLFESNQYGCENLEITSEIKNYIDKFKSSEELLKNGGIPIEMLDRLAFGFSEEDITELEPTQLKIKWKEDLENVKWEIKKSGLTPKKWAEKIKLDEPIDVSLEKGEFYIEDGHHRFMAAKVLNKKLKVNLTIKTNPIVKLSKLSYDDFHRCLFEKNKGTLTEIKKEKTLTVYHGTQPKFVEPIQKNGLIDKTGYNQGWYMVSTDFESALFHANPENKGGDVYVIEFKIPLVKNKYWDGYPYLWKGQRRTDNSVWFALMNKIPKDFINDIKIVNYNDWSNQKNKGF